MRSLPLSWLVLCLLPAVPPITPYAEEVAHVVVDEVWAGHPVAFALLTAPPLQYVGYYDADRRMVIASRRLDAAQWTRQVLDERIRWDSHNSIRMALDDTGRLHVAGNMHGHPLKYFRTREAGEVSTLERVAAMVGRDEGRVTYPEFLTGPEGQFIFKYRDGGSGAGNEIYNIYDAGTLTWKRLLDSPLVDGEGQRNAYFDGPKLGLDGFYHLCWVWRDTPDCETNHHPSYARSRDLVHWENSRGEAYSLPITFETAETIDKVPPGGGIINGNTRLGFDTAGRPVVSYHKFDAYGNTQLYNARPLAGAWQITQATDWEYRWEFSGRGSIHFEIRVHPVETLPDGSLVQSWSHARHGSQRWRLDPHSLAPVERLEVSRPSSPPAFRRLRSDFPGMAVRTASDTGSSGGSGMRYVLRWETLGHNRDRPREEPWPAPSQLEVWELRE